MPYLGILKKKDSCAICKKALKAGSRVFHDPSKSSSNNIVHEKCWVDLKASRGLSLVKTGPKKSTAELDPPF